MISLPLRSAVLSSSDINVRQMAEFDSRITFTSSFEIVSRFFSKNPYAWYRTVSEKCLITNAVGEKESRKMVCVIKVFSSKQDRVERERTVDFYWNLQAFPKRAFSKCLYLAHFSFNLPTHDSSEPRGICLVKKEQEKFRKNQLKMGFLLKIE